MTQQIGETRDALIEADNEQIRKILDANKDKTDPYWIVIFAKPAKGHVEGKPALVKVVKAYTKKPDSQVGLIIGTVSNQSGEIKWEVNLPQAPIDYGKILTLGGEVADKIVTETTTIPHAYITQ